MPQFSPGDPAYIEFLGFGGHFGGASFFKDLYELAERVGAMVYAGGTVIATKETVLEEISEDFLGMENARIVRNASELEEAVFAS